MTGDLARPATWAWSRWRVVCALGFVVVTVTVTILVRPLTAPLVDTVWAEDGSHFLRLALERSTIGALSATYAGYLHLVPRILAEAATLGPLSSAADVVAIGAAVVVSSASVLVFHASSGYVRSPWLRGGLAILMALIPLSGLESMGNLTNLHWYVTFTAFWVLLWRPRGRAGAVVAGVTLVVAVLTSPQALLLVPVALIRLLRPRRPEVLWPTLAYLAAAALHVVVIVWVVEPGVGLVGSPLGEIAAAYLQRVSALVVSGHGLSMALWNRFGWWWPTAATVLTAGLVLMGAARADTSSRLVIGLTVTYSIGFLFTATFWRGTAYAMIWSPGAAHGELDRYQILPALLLWSAMAVAIDRASSSLERTLRTGAIAASLVLIAGIVATNLRAETYRDGPSWDAEVTAARARCDTGPRSDVTLSIDPGGWTTTLDCEVLGGD